ncbi:MAG: PQQ-binding-like beta-propeller repeat protein, partial [Pseudomonadota bacterium]
MALWRSLGVLSLATGLVACGPPEPTIDVVETEIVEEDTISEQAFADVDTARILAADQRPDEWLTYGGNYDETRHSLLQKVNLETVERLGVAWTYDLRTARGVESTPIVVDGVMYVTSAWSVVHALDAETGEELWVHEPDVDR